MMKRLTIYLGFALAACLSCFSLSALAQPVVSAYHAAFTIGEPQGVALKRLELTLAMWQTGSQSTDEGLKTNLRASSNHFVMTSAKPLPDGDGLTPC
ncbi:hypothetical protein D3879_14730 [Pseudomonas cavernicola]|uniref:Uncharacterized protein n=1 Tax=Pseudomonas cavernicola TaxID=2320866 RepID=A0A418XEH8_9PSED|nr:hypothetical protein [Pseudomonas cavernicola]RJG10932.1 hypothetical protein D3879_14730 [Pseudomonas cavernicola]